MRSREGRAGSRARPSLRRRLALGLLAYALLLLGVALATVFVVDQSSERAVRGSTLLENLDERLGERPDMDLEGDASMRLFVSHAGVPAAGMPNAFRSLAPGLHLEVEDGDLLYAVLVRDVRNARLYLAMDATQQERSERHRLLTAAMVLVAALLLLLGLSWWSARQLLAPVNELSAALARLDPGRRGMRLDVHDTEELASIEDAANLFLERLDGFVQREKEFIDTVSHELRTPIAVVAGAADVLAARTEGKGPADEPVLRIRDAVADMNDTLSVLLFLAKEPVGGGPEVACDVDLLLPGLVADHEHLCRGKAVVVCVQQLRPLRVAAPPRLVAIAIGNLLRNAIEHTYSGTVTVDLVDGCLAIEDGGAGVGAEQISRAYSAMARSTPHRPVGAGIGLHIVGRLCERFGWRLALAAKDAGGTRATIDFDPH